MPVKAKLGRPPASPAAPYKLVGSVLQNLKSAKEHEDVGAEPVQTQVEATQAPAVPTTPATPVTPRSSVADGDAAPTLDYLGFDSERTDGDQMGLGYVESECTEGGGSVAQSEVEEVGTCVTCKKPVLSTERKLTWNSNVGTGVQYWKHIECQKMQNMMSHLLRTGGNDRLKDLWTAEPMAERMAWWHKHPGLTSDQLKTELEATYAERMSEERELKHTYRGVPTDETTLRKKYLPDRQDMFDNIMKNAERFTCPVSGATLYEDPGYEKDKTYTEQAEKTRKRTAEQTSTVKPKKALKGPGAAAAVKNCDTEVDGVATDTKTKTIKKDSGEKEKKPMTDQIKKRFAKCAEKAADAMQELGALNEKLNENITLMIPEKSILLLREWEQEVKSISMQVEKIIAAGESDVSVNAFSKKAADNMDKLKKQIQLVGDLVQQLA